MGGFLPDAAQVCQTACNSVVDDATGFDTPWWVGGWDERDSVDTTGTGVTGQNIKLKYKLQTWIVDQPFPSDCGAWLLEVHSHDNVKVGDILLRLILELGCIFFSSFNVVDRAWPLVANRNGERSVVSNIRTKEGGRERGREMSGGCTAWEHVMGAGAF